ncbi:hypothetical protein [Paenibacillus sp. PAMC21692]|uniref:hypothetical protein n=1 Tax=Paenibacillus sp. PAMC21692 TaxID=2762320 RepID=UPI00164DF0CE|nr:hypothetical protein [Paenibacillus sp. PAMC21692]QNK60301.1 hypothetical protein H7F31_16385 [Paenibacillus sp. PAMC21692]
MNRPFCTLMTVIIVLVSVTACTVQNDAQEQAVEMTHNSRNEKDIVKSEVAKGINDMPSQDLNRDNILGQTGVLKETNESSPKGAHFTYLYTDEAGEEEILLELYARNIDEIDLDEDGITELVVLMPGPLMSARIYDLVDGKISYIDVNEVLGSNWSSSLNGVGNVKREYLKGIQAGFENEDGSSRIEVYSFKDLQPIYIAPLSDVKM